MPLRKLSSIQVFENLVIPEVSTNVNKNLVAGKNTVVGISEVTLELEGAMVVATFKKAKGGKNPTITVGIPLTFVRTLVFE